METLTVPSASKIIVGLSNRIEQLKYACSEQNVFSTNRAYVVQLLKTVIPEDTDAFERHEKSLTDALNIITSTLQEIQTV